MAISRDTFDPQSNYKKVVYHQDRNLLDSELNEQNQIHFHEQKKFGGAIFNEGAILEGLNIVKTGNVLAVAPGTLYLEGLIEQVPGKTLTFDPAKTSGVDYVYVELLRYTYSAVQDGTLVNPATGEHTAEREKWVLHLRASDTSNETLPSLVTERTVVPIYKFDRDTDTVSPTITRKNKLWLEDLMGNLSGNRITVASIGENQLNFQAAEGLNSLLQNLAERTDDQAGSYLVKGFESFLGSQQSDNVEVTTNAGRAYVKGYRLQRDLPTSSLVPISMATKGVRGEQKTHLGNRRYALNSRPLKETSQVEAIVEVTANLTRGSVGGGEDLLPKVPAVNILEVSQGATPFNVGTDWQQSGNYVDWLGTGLEPGIGTTYTVRWTYTKQLVKGTDYVDGGWFGETNHPSAGTYHYAVTALDTVGETQYNPATVVMRETSAGSLNELSWLPVNGASGYRVYRGTQNTGRTDFELLADLGSTTFNYIDDGVDDTTPGAHPQDTNTSNLGGAPPFQGFEGNLNIINFGRSGVGTEPVLGSNCSVDYEYYLGRFDIIYALNGEIKRLEGPPSDFPKLPAPPANALALCSIECPPNSSQMVIENFGLTRVTMDRIHQIIKDVEDLKYNDAQTAMNADLQNRTPVTKKGVYSDDFSNTAQSDAFHADWSARVDEHLQFVAPSRVAAANPLVVDYAASNATFHGSLALLPASEVVLVAQDDWSETKNINPFQAFEPLEPTLELTPNIGRLGQTGIAVTGVNFTPNASGIQVTCDGKVVASGISADAIGRVSAAFVIPGDVQTGERIVSVTDGIKKAEIDLEINDPLVITRIQRVVINRTIIRNQVVHRPPPVLLGPPDVNEPDRPLTRPRIIRKDVDRRIWRQQFRPTKIDPLAQTLSFSQSRIIPNIAFIAESKDASLPVVVQIRGVTTGLPNAVVLAEKVIAPDEVNLNSPTVVQFVEPVYVPASTSVAIVLLTNSANYRVRIATLGQPGQNGIITRQAYPQGVLLESSNAESWNPLNASDLTTQVKGYAFEPTGVVQFLPISGVQFSELNLDEYSAIPDGTSINWEYSTDGGDTWDAIVPAEEENLPNVANQVLVRATFYSGNSHESPALNIRDINLVGYLNNESGTYVSRENGLTQEVASTNLYTQMEIPSGTAVHWMATNDGGVTWETLDLEDTRPIDSEWTEYTYSKIFSDPTGNQVRYKAEMTGTHLVYPRIHTLGATLS